jgi:hypothetical protein
MIMADGTDFAQIQSLQIEPLENLEWSDMGRSSPTLATLLVWLMIGVSLGVFWREMFGLVARLFA